MNGKATKAKPKMADVTKPKKTTTAPSGAEPLIIQSRPMIGRATTTGSPSDDQPAQDDSAAPAATPSAPVLPSQSKRTLIVPVSDGENKVEAPVKAAVTSEVSAAAAKSAAAKPATDTDTPADAPADDAATEAPEPTTEAPKQSEEPPEKAADADGPGTDESASDDNNPANKGDKPNPETEKAIAEAAAAAKRDQELEALIDSKQFYVPINAVARKKEVKHSVLMTVIVLLLAIVLIDLMLDSGLIFLAERIPHTHFFTTSSIDQ